MKFTELKAMSLFMGLSVNELPSNSLFHKGQDSGIGILMEAVGAPMK